MTHTGVMYTAFDTNTDDAVLFFHYIKVGVEKSRRHWREESFRKENDPIVQSEHIASKYVLLLYIHIVCTMKGEKTSPC